jgi:3-polyprenyl-4-hydroxybenzoate decarboxylase
MFHKLILISLILIIAMVDEGVGRVLDTFGVNVEGLYTPWEGL